MGGQGLETAIDKGAGVVPAEQEARAGPTEQEATRVEQRTTT